MNYHLNPTGVSTICFTKLEQNYTIVFLFKLQQKRSMDKTILDMKIYLCSKTYALKNLLQLLRMEWYISILMHEQGIIMERSSDLREKLLPAFFLK